MNIKNSKNWSTVPRPHAYAVAVLITIAAFVLRYTFHSYFEPHAPLKMFFIGCLATEFLVGLGPALLSGILGLMLGTYYFIVPYGAFDGISHSDVIVTANFVFSTLFAVILVEYLHRMRYSNQLLLKISQSRHRISLYRENDRLYLIKKSAAAIQPIEKFFSEFNRILLLKLPGNEIYLQPLFYQLCPAPLHGPDKDDWITCVHPEDRPALQTAFSQVEGGANRHSLQARMVGPANSYRTWSLVLERLQFGGEQAVILKLSEPEKQSAPMPVEGAAEI